MDLGWYKELKYDEEMHRITADRPSIIKIFLLCSARYQPPSGDVNRQVPSERALHPRPTKGSAKAQSDQRLKYSMNEPGDERESERGNEKAKKDEKGK